jgi:hypothetical protein
MPVAHRPVLPGSLIKDSSNFVEAWLTNKGLNYEFDFFVYCIDHFSTNLFTFVNL